MKISEEEAYNIIKKGVEAINTRPYATLAEYEKVECIKILLKAYKKQQIYIQQEIEELKTKNKMYMVTCNRGYGKTYNILKGYISEDKIKGLIQEIESYAYTSSEEREKQDYAIYELKRLLEV